MSSRTETSSKRRRKLEHDSSETHPSKKLKQKESTGKTAKRQSHNVESTQDIPVQGGPVNGDRIVPKVNGHANSETSHLDNDTSRDQSKSKKQKEARNQKNKERRLADSIENGTPHVNQNGIIALVDIAENPTTTLSNPADFSWTVSDSVGGLFRYIDPIFSADESQILLATKFNLNVYSVETSLLTRKISVATESAIVDVSPSLLDDSHVFIVLSNGNVELWNWAEGKQVSSYQISKDLVMLRSFLNEDGQETVVVAARERGDVTQSTIVTFVPSARQSKEGPELTTIWQGKDQLLRLQIFNNGNAIFASSESCVIVGRVKYTKDRQSIRLWKVLDFPEGLACVDVYRHDNPGQDVGVTKNGALTIALGSRNGAIYVYDDFLALLNKTTALKPRKLHWHRSRVEALKFSADGNYLISGGRETVLVLWQLDTNRRQDLPNLTASIQNITVSPSGTSYALRLTDNSVVVLSTSELTPKAVIASVQARGTSDLIPSSNDVNLVTSTPATSDPTDPTRILLAVPASQRPNPDDNTLSSAPFLQAYDIALGRHISRQALTRNNVININTAPKGSKIAEANLVHIQTSADGKWLATAEEWVPPAADISYLTADSETLHSERKERRETFLKFWTFQDSTQQWALESRVDQPHHFNLIPSASRILDLTTTPSGLGFATVGEDSMIRIWSPKTRLEDGRIVRGVRPDGISNWVCSVAIDVGKVTKKVEFDSDSQVHGLPRSARLAFSADGSVLAVSLDGSGGLVHLFDAATGELQSSQPSMYSGRLTGLQFLDRYLVILSKDLRVWDTITNLLVLGYPLGGLHTHSQHLAHLAVSSDQDVFAISYCYSAGPDAVNSRVAIFKASSSQPLLITETSGVVTALIALPGPAGFAIVDAHAQVRLLRPKTAASFDPIAIAAASEGHTIDTMEDIKENTAFDLLDSGDAVDVGDDPLDESDIEDERPVVRADQLAEIFEGKPAFALPPIQEMFHAVAKLYIGKEPSTQGTAFVRAG